MSLVAIQTKHGEIDSPNFFIARDGFLKKGYEVMLFDPDHLPLGDDPIIVGGIPVVKRALAQLGTPLRVELDYPDSVRGFLGRRVWRGVLGDLSGLESVFVKPLDQKRFKGVLVREFRDRLEFSSQPDDLPVYFSDPFPFVSEWRCYVVEGEMVQMCYYRGDAFCFPDPEIPRRILMAMQEAGEAPISFGIDVGVGLDGGTYLVEVNDGFALGNYGLPSIPYAHLIETRWRELRAFCATGVE
jgi:hypothetical protein